MFGTAVAWLILMGLGLILTQLVLKKRGMAPKQRRQALMMAAGVVVALLIVAVMSAVSATWSDSFSDPILRGADVASGGDSWGLVAGKVSDKSRISEKRYGYAVYAEYSGLDRELRTFRGDRDLVVELKDGALVYFDRFDTPQHTWNWKEKRGFRYLKPGDPVVSYGMLRPRRPSKKLSKKKRFSIGHVSFVYRGSLASFESSSLSIAGKAAKWVNLAVAALCVVGALVLAGLVFARRKPPEEAS